VRRDLGFIETPVKGLNSVCGPALLSRFALSVRGFGCLQVTGPSGSLGWCDYATVGKVSTDKVSVAIGSFSVPQVLTHFGA